MNELNTLEFYITLGWKGLPPDLRGTAGTSLINHFEP
jgi:hypothetical protein